MTTELAVMTTQEDADRLYQFCKEGKWEEAQDALFSKEAESIEPPHSQGVQHVQGLDNIKAKAKSFSSQVEEVHGGYVKGPLVAGNFVSLAIGMDVTMKGAGRMNMEEIALYEVRDGQIVKEQFFF
jgi:hypothetical protein